MALSNNQPVSGIWNKADLTYSIHSYATFEISKQQIESETARAFQMWQDVENNPLTFRRVNDTIGDIELEFFSGEHGDEWPFDGPKATFAHAYTPTSLS